MKTRLSFLFFLWLINLGNLAAQDLDTAAWQRALLEEDIETVLQLADAYLAQSPPSQKAIPVLLERAKYHFWSGELDQSKQDYQEVIIALEALEEKQPRLYTEALTGLGYLFYHQDKDEAAIEQYQSATVEAQKGGFDSLHIISQLQLGNLYDNMGLLNKAIANYQAALEAVQSNPQRYPYLYVDALHKMARSYEMQYRYNESEALYQEGYYFAQQQINPLSHLYTVLRNDFGMLYFFQRDYRKAIPFFEETKRAVEAGQLGLAWSTGTYCNLADCYAHLGRYAEAKKLYETTMPVDLKSFGESHPNYIVTLSRMGDLYAFQSEWEKAEDYHQRAVALARQHIVPAFIDYPYIMEQAFLLYQKRGNWQEVRRLARLSLQGNCLQELPTQTPLIDKTIATDYPFSNMPYALRAVIALSWSYQKAYEAGDEEEASLVTAFELLQTARLMLHRIKNSFYTELDKLNMLRLSGQISERGIELAQKLYASTQVPRYEQAIFQFVEDNKSILLQDALRSRSRQRFGALPEALYQEQKRLSEALSLAKAQRLQAVSPADKQQSNKAYNEALQALRQFEERLQKEQPNYYALRLQNSDLDFTALQKRLAADEVLIEYFVGEKQLYCWTMTQAQQTFFQLPIPKDSLERQVSRLRRLLSDYSYLSERGLAAVPEYQDLAYWFYEKLLSFIPKEFPEAKAWIIIPDRALGHLPFEAFVDERRPQAQRFTELQYLLKRYNIRYLHSAKFLQQPLVKGNASESLLAIAADYDSDAPATEQRSGDRLRNAQQLLRQRLQPLPAARQEVEQLQAEFDGRFLLGAEATEAQFKALAPDYRILHLAMHGLLNENKPLLSSLAFTEDGSQEEDNFLEAWEISQMALSAELVTLSACETGYGKFQQGEGVMSLARSFSYAGTPSLVVSLWQVSDESTAQIMAEFYRQLALGKPKDEALRAAKLLYLAQNADQPLQAHPAFWAPFIQIGQARPISLTADRPLRTYLLGGLGLAVVLGAGLFWWMRREQ